MSDYIRIKVRGYHLDQHGHLKNSSYMEFLEEARWVLFENNNADDFFSKNDLALTLVNVNMDYRRPCFLNEVLEIHTKVMRIGTTSCKVDQTIYLEGSTTIIVEATCTFVLVDKTTNKAVPIAGKAREKLEQLAMSV